MNYFHVEFQFDGTTGSAIVSSYTNLTDALDKHYTVMKYANTSTVAQHGSVVFNDMMGVEIFDIGRRDTQIENKAYFILEFQTNEDSSAMLWDVRYDLPHAYEKYYQLQSVAAVSSIENHGIMILASDMFEVMKAFAYREAAETPEK